MSRVALAILGVSFLVCIATQGIVNGARHFASALAIGLAVGFIIGLRIRRKGRS